MSSRFSSYQRARRLPDGDSPSRTSAGVSALHNLMLATILFVPHAQFINFWPFVVFDGFIEADTERRMTRASNLAAKVFTPRKTPAAGATVALALTNAPIHIIDSKIMDGAADCARTVADSVGRFHLPPQDRSFSLVVTHVSG